MRIWMSAIVAILVCGLVGIAQAKKAGEGTQPDKVLKGQLVSVSADGTTVVIMTIGKKASEVTVTTDPKTTKVTIDGAAAKLSDLQKDQMVEIAPAIGTATSIKATTKDKKPK